MLRINVCLCVVVSLTTYVHFCLWVHKFKYLHVQLHIHQALSLMEHISIHSSHTELGISYLITIPLCRKVLHMALAAFSGCLSQ